MQQCSYSNTLPDTRPDIISLVEKYTHLRRAGNQLHGLCPLHSEKTPSFVVNPDRGVWYCHGCHTGGDVIAFVRIAEKLSFPEALKFLDMAGEPSPNTLWAREQRRKLNARIRELDEQIELADEIPDAELAEAFWHERRIVADARDDLSRVDAPDFVEIRSLVERIVRG